MGVGTLQSGFRGATRKGDLTAQNEEERGGGRGRGQKQVKSHSRESRGRATCGIFGVKR